MSSGWLCLLVVFIFAAMVALMELQRWSTRSTFIANRRPLTDDEFVKSFDATPDDARLLLSIRRAIARPCGVPAEFILPNENPRKLGHLMFSGWDYLDFVLRLEIDLRMKLRRFDRDAFSEALRRPTLESCIRRVLPTLREQVADPTARYPE